VGAVLPWRGIIIISTNVRDFDRPMNHWQSSASEPYNGYIAGLDMIAPIGEEE
jgi:hypothetical protein